jgi:aryl-alcohol dehydrogenase-like predicted oxidoreductase
MQNHYNIIYREEEREMMKLCVEEGIGVIPWSPLARGRVARPWKAEITKRAETDKFGNTMYGVTEESDKRVVDCVGQVAQQRGISYAQVALAWMLAKPFITAPIVGATKPGHLEDAVAALSVNLSEDEVRLLESQYVPHPVMGF